MSFLFFERCARETYNPIGWVLRIGRHEFTLWYRDMARRTAAGKEH